MSSTRKSLLVDSDVSIKTRVLNTETMLCHASRNHRTQTYIYLHIQGKRDTKKETPTAKIAALRLIFLPTF
jgi:hypothetical protein